MRGNDRITFDTGKIPTTVSPQNSCLRRRHQYADHPHTLGVWPSSLDNRLIAARKGAATESTPSISSVALQYRRQISPRLESN